MSKKSLWNGPALCTSRGYLICGEFGVRLYREEMFKGKTAYSKAGMADKSNGLKNNQPEGKLFP